MASAHEDRRCCDRRTNTGPRICQSQPSANMMQMSCAVQSRYCLQHLLPKAGASANSTARPATECWGSIYSGSRVGDVRTAWRRWARPYFIEGAHYPQCAPRPPPPATMTECECMLLNDDVAFQEATDYNAHGNNLAGNTLFVGDCSLCGELLPRIRLFPFHLCQSPLHPHQSPCVSTSSALATTSTSP